MFWIWLLPVLALLGLLIWMVFAASRRRVKTGRRTDGEVILDEERRDSDAR